MRSLILSVVTILIHAAGAIAQSATKDTTVSSSLGGTVRDEGSRPIALVTIAAVGSDRATVTDSLGRFRFEGVSVGITSFTATRMGYTPFAFDATLSPDSTVTIDIVMRSVQSLEGVDVVAERRSPRLIRDGFYERLRIGGGKYVTPEQVEELSHHVGTPAQLLRNINGIRVDCSATARRETGGCIVRGGSQQESIQGRWQRGCMALFIDGSYTPGELDENLSVGAVYAIEVYNRGNLVPGQYATPRTQRCGALLVWTRSRAP